MVVDSGRGARVRVGLGGSTSDGQLAREATHDRRLCETGLGTNHRWDIIPY